MGNGQNKRERNKKTPTDREFRLAAVGGNGPLRVSKFFFQNQSSQGKYHVNLLQSVE